jgi:hypothetical protein
MWFLALALALLFVTATAFCSGVEGDEDEYDEGEDGDEGRLLVSVDDPA